MFALCRKFHRVEIPRGVKVISHAFRHCDDLAVIPLYPGLRRIERSAFDSCGKLRNIFFMGSREEWESIEKEPGWDSGCGEYKLHFTE